jgi:Uma2 family endonuclease
VNRTCAPHSRLAAASGEVEWLLRLSGGKGKVVTECPVQTSKGVRVADVAWRSSAFLKKHGIRNLKLPESPEVVVEIESPSNTAAELKEKRHLYFEVGAREFWLCHENGNMRFFNPQGELKISGFFGKFPGHIDIEVAESRGNGPSYPGVCPERAQP